MEVVVPTIESTMLFKQVPQSETVFLILTVTAGRQIKLDLGAQRIHLAWPEVQREYDFLPVQMLTNNGAVDCLIAAQNLPPAVEIVVGQSLWYYRVRGQGGERVEALPICQAHKNTRLKVNPWAEAQTAWHTTAGEILLVDVYEIVTGQPIHHHLVRVDALPDGTLYNYRHESA